MTAQHTDVPVPAAAELGDGLVAAHGGWIADGHTVTFHVSETEGGATVSCPVGRAVGSGSVGGCFPCRVVIDESGVEDASHALSECRLVSSRGGTFAGRPMIVRGLAELDVPPRRPYVVSRANIPIEWQWNPWSRRVWWRPIADELVYSDRWARYLDDPASGRREDRLRHAFAFLTAAYDDYRAVLGEITGDADAPRMSADEAAAALRGRFVARQAVVEDLRRRVDGAGDAKQLRDVVLAIAADLAETSGDPS
jgi:hypothetical protein